MMNLFYNLLMEVGENILRMISSHHPVSPNPNKLFRLSRGQQGLTERIRQAMRNGERFDRHRDTVWFHAASIGEYAVIRPIMQALRKKTGCRIVLTFFSPSGVDLFSTFHPDADYVFYLPWDTSSNAREFLDAVRPSKAVFAISEYWVNHLEELYRRHIPVYLVSALVTGRSPFVHWWGGLYRRILRHYAHITVADEASRDRLLRLGANRVAQTGDPLFDNAIQIARTEWHNEVVERFAAQDPVFIAGSVSDKKDLRLVAVLANRHPHTRFIIVPHEISEKTLFGIIAALDGHTRLYSECDDTTDFSHVQTLVIDTMGMLAYIYRYAHWAYVGGGFTPYLHSVIEPVVYGLPVAFGPKLSRKVAARQLVGRGIGCVVHDGDDLNRWFEGLNGNKPRTDAIRKSAMEYVQTNEGATTRIVDIINRGEVPHS